MPRPQSNVVVLKKSQRQELLRITAHGIGSPQQIRRAHILLLADRSTGNRREDQEIASFLQVTSMTVLNTRKRFCQQGLKGIQHKKGGGRPKKIDGEIEAYMIAIACSPPPKERVRWTLQLIADKLVELAYLDSISAPSVYNTLKKMKQSHGLRKSGKSLLEKTPNSCTAWKGS